MSITTTHDPDAETVEPAVAAAFVKYLMSLEQPYGPVILTATTGLEKAATDADVRLCAWGDLSPYDVTVRSCCDTPTCANHDADHDLLCLNFLAQRREEAGL